MEKTDILVVQSDKCTSPVKIDDIHIDLCEFQVERDRLEEVQGRSCVETVENQVGVIFGYAPNRYLIHICLLWREPSNRYLYEETETMQST